MTVDINNAQKRIKRLQKDAIIWIFLITLVLGGLLIVSMHQQRIILDELSRRPVIGYSVFPGVRTIFIMNFAIHEVYWFTDCPRMKEFTPGRAVAVYGDHLNQCHDWHFLDSDLLTSHASRP